MSAPAFLNKPKHKDNVIATPKGWAVEKTGELLVSVKNLDQRIAEHLGLASFKFDGLAAQVDASVIAELTAVEAPVVTDTALDSLLDTLDTAKPDVVVEDIVEDVIKESEKVEAPVVAEKKKRGGYRPRKEKVVA